MSTLLCCGFLMVKESQAPRHARPNLDKFLIKTPKDGSGARETAIYAFNMIVI
jgi:hypothetical protein